MQISARLFIFVYQRVRRLPVYPILFLGAKHFRGHFVFAIYGSVCIYLIPVETSRPIIVTPGLQGAHSTHLFREASLLASRASARGIYAGTSRGRGRGGNVRRLRQVRFNNPSFLKSLASHLFITSGFSVSLSLGFSQPTKLLELLP